MTTLLCPLQKIVATIGDEKIRIMQIVRKTGYAPQTVRKTIDFLREKGFVEEERIGKYAYVRLTEKGKILKYCIDVIRLLEEGVDVEELHLRVAAPRWISGTSG